MAKVKNKEKCLKAAREKQPYKIVPIMLSGEGYSNPLQYSCLGNPMGGGAWQATVHGVAKSRIRLSDFTFTFHFHTLEKEMATHSSVLALSADDTTLMAESEEELKSLLMKVKEESEKVA